jgi:hypothetical protein
MGRYLDLIQARSDAAKAEVRGYDKNDRNDQRVYDRNDQRGLRSYMSFLSYSGTCSFDGQLDVPAESGSQASSASPDGTTKTTETTKVTAVSATQSTTSNYASAEGQVISPARWAGIAADELPFDEPCSERRGLIERRGALFLHFCVECGRWGAYGYDLAHDRPGRWYCRQHRPDEVPR